VLDVTFNRDGRLVARVTYIRATEGVFAVLRVTEDGLEYYAGAQDMADLAAINVTAEADAVIAVTCRENLDQWQAMRFLLADERCKDPCGAPAPGSIHATACGMAQRRPPR
jgi:uncharacterized protein YkuJ